MMTKSPGKFEAPSLNLIDLTFRQVEEIMIRRPSLIFPVGSIEPAGDRIALGAINTCCDLIARALSERLQVFVAPLLAYGDSYPFKSFGGSAGIRRKTCSNVVVECCNCWISQGFKSIMILTLSMDGRKWTGTAAKRLGTGGSRGEVRFCSLQDEESFRSYCGKRSGIDEQGRSEWGIGALISYLKPEMLGSLEGGERSIPERPVFTRWHRRGRDPQKLRKMTASATLSPSPVTGGFESGRELFMHVLDFLDREYSSFLTGS